jgi:hypothetical protein
VVVTLFRSNRARDRSHFETFRGYHEALYRGVEPTSVTPWSLSSRERSLAGALVMLIRHSVPQLANDEAASRLNLEDSSQDTAITAVVDKLLAVVRHAEPLEEQETRDDLWRLLREWDHRAGQAREADGKLTYERRKSDDTALLKDYGQQAEGWVAAHSMRTVEPSLAVQVMEPSEGGATWSA